MIKLSELGTRCVENALEHLDERLYSVPCGDGQSARAFSQVEIRSSPAIEVTGRTARWDGTS
jgi:hypothetical protein